MNVHAARRPAPSRRRPHPLVDEALRGAAATGATLLLVLPEARGMHPMLGWLPLWLLGMPLVAWWAAHGFPLPGRASAEAPRRPAMPRRVAQARRRARIRPQARHPRAA